MVVIDNKQYYTVEEAATLAGVSVRTLRRWLSADRLADFLYPFRASPSEVLYRLEPPEDSDMKNKKGEYIICKDRPPKGGGSDEGVSSS